jgi:hypothetical protein
MITMCALHMYGRRTNTGETTKQLLSLLPPPPASTSMAHCCRAASQPVNQQGKALLQHCPQLLLLQLTLLHPYCVLLAGAHHSSRNPSTHLPLLPAHSTLLPPIGLTWHRQLPQHHKAYSSASTHLPGGLQWHHRPPAKPTGC